ncbi:glutamate receptor [Musa troglodytarum]|uniref:Glutamate receptor n=1 Tax=Musa troglodytarum TaxID=320322 RepID=A0A9E7FMR5_9LILI|nr:glutamate receptor [Musa troglodytarum]
MFASQNLFFSILFLSSALFLTGAANINIGAIVNTDLRIGREQKVAMEIAAQHFNSSSSPIFLDVSELNSSSDPFEVITRAKDLISWGAEAIIGTGTWPEVAALSKAVDTSRIPVLSLAPTPTSSSRMPSVVQMSYPATGEARCLAAIIRSFNWRRVIVIYEKDIYGSSSRVLALFSDALRDSGSQIDYQIAFPPLATVSDATDMIRRTLKGIPRQLSKVFLLIRSSPELTVELFEQAKELGMMAKDHVWIVNDDVTALLDATLTPFFISSYMQGVIGISTFVNNTTTSSYHAFSSVFQRRFKQEYELKGEHRFEPGRHAVRAYDAVHAIAYAAAATANKAENGSVTTLQGILSTKFTGLSGFIEFTRDGFLPERRDRSAFRVLNVVGKSYKDLGFWSEGYGFFENETDMSRHERVVDVLRPVFWPGGTDKIPGGWGTLKIGIPKATTFDQFVKVEYDTDGNLQPTGFCIDVFQEILKRLKYDLIYEFQAFDGSYDDLVNKVPSQEVDAVVGDITILAKRAVNATFTVPFLSSGLSMLVPVKPNHTPWMFMKPFTKEVWLLILATLVYTAGVVWYLERESNPVFHGTPWVQLGATVWLILSTIFFAHGEQNRSQLPSRSIFVCLTRNSIYFPRAGRVYSYYTKTVVIVWLVVVLILTTSFTANLSSILTIEKLEPVPPGSRVGCDGDSFVLKYLQEVLLYKNSRIERIGEPEEYVKAFKSGNITAAYLETPYLRVFLSQHQDFSVIGETHRLGGFGFVFPKHSLLADDFSDVILQLAENGTLKELENKWFTFTLSNSPSPDNNRERDSLSLDCFWLLFLFTGCTSTIVLLLNVTGTSVAVLRRSFMVLWRSTTNLSPREGLELPKVVPMSSHQEDTHHANTTDVV